MDISKERRNVSERQIEPELTSCLPDELRLFSGREAEISEVIALLKDEKKAVVSLHGGPGFGKTAIAIQVSHQLSEDHKIPVLFSQLTTATNEYEMIRQLCLDIGVNHAVDHKPSLIFWLKSIKRNVILVLDDIDNLLEDKTNFYQFIRLLRKNSNQHCQIITTSRMLCEIPDLATDKIQVKEMDAEACLELLKKQCSQQDDILFRKLAELSGYIPLSMCIAGSLVDDYEDPNELLQFPDQQPMKTLKCPNSNQYVDRAINLSYEKCSHEEQETIVRLSVFVGGFSKIAAETVIEKGNFKTTDMLEKLVSRCLIKQSAKHRYSIHPLIKHFLKDKQKSADEKSKRARAEVLMVEHYLELGHQLTIESYSKDSYKDSREALKREASNIQNVLKIVCEQEDPIRPDISECIARSKIYTTSARLFSLFVRTIIPGSNMDEFLQRCASLAKKRRQIRMKIDFDCLLADQERIKSIGKSDELFLSTMEEIKKAFETYYENMKEDKSLCAHFYFQNAEYLLRQAQTASHEKKLDLQIEARKDLRKSLELRETLAETSVGKADKIFSLLCLGKVCKYISASERFLKKENKNAWEQARKYFEEAVQLSQEHLGEHELTSSCYKHLGDLLFDKREMAEEFYTTAREMQEQLGLDASERHVRLLNNLGKYLRETGNQIKAIEVLKSARDTAEKLAENDEPTVWKTKVYTSLALTYDLVGKKSQAARYAKRALEFGRIEKIIKTYEHVRLRQISEL